MSETIVVDQNPGHFSPSWLQNQAIRIPWTLDMWDCEKLSKMLDTAVYRVSEYPPLFNFKRCDMYHSGTSFRKDEIGPHGYSGVPPLKERLFM